MDCPTHEILENKCVMNINDFTVLYSSGGNNTAVIFSDKACKVFIMDFFCIYRVDWCNISSMDCCKMKAWIAVTFLVSCMDWCKNNESMD